MTPRLLTLPAESLDGYQACLRDVLELLDRVALQPAIAHAPALRVVLEERAAMLPELHKLLSPKVAVINGAALQGLDAAIRDWKASGPAPSPLPPESADWPWTPERDAALMEWSATTQDDVLLLEVVNALPGPRLDSRAAVRTRLDWLRRQADDAAQRAEEAQDGLADAVAEATPAAPAPKPKPKPKQQKGEWTAERLELLKAEGPQTEPRAMLARLNALPGAPIASVGALRLKAREIGATRDLRPIMDRLAPGVSHDDKSLQASARLALNGSGEWTHARLDLLRAEYGDIQRPLDAILLKVNALPGNPIASVESMRHKARALGLTRAIPQEERLARMNAARLEKASAKPAAPDHVPDTTKMVEADQPTPTPEPEPEAAPAPPPPPEEAPPQPAPTPPAAKPAPEPPAPRSLKATTPWIAAAIAGKAPVAPVAAELDPWASTNPYRLTEEAEAEALAMLRAGQGAKALHEEFGGRLDWWQRWAGEKRQEGRAA